MIERKWAYFGDNHLNKNKGEFRKEKKILMYVRAKISLNYIRKFKQ